MIHKCVTITEQQQQWIEKNHINLSRFLQAKIEKERKNDRIKM